MAVGNAERETTMRGLVERHSMRGVVHSLVEVCHGKRADADAADDDRGREVWGAVCRALTEVESLADRFGV
jgi:hypothetical protein